MALSGMNKRALKELNASVECYVGLEEVFKLAKEKEITRSMAGVELAAKENVDIFVFGNAPTALFKLRELIKEGKANPKLIVAVPVGFVGASESKEDLDELGIRTMPGTNTPYCIILSDNSSIFLSLIVIIPNDGIQSMMTISKREFYKEFGDNFQSFKKIFSEDID